jgi:hypothetical protein
MVFEAQIQKALKSVNGKQVSCYLGIALTATYSANKSEETHQNS